MRRKIIKPNGTVCPLCQSEEHVEFYTLDFLQMNICWSCLLDISCDVYTFFGGYFERIAGLLFMSPWECRKLYLLDVIKNHPERSDFKPQECWRQVKAISIYLKSTKSESDFKNLLSHLKVDAVGLDMD